MILQAGSNPKSVRTARPVAGKIKVRSHIVAGFCLAGVIGLSPLWYASYNFTARAGNGVALGLIVLVFAAWIFVRPAALPVPFSKVAVPACLFAASVAWAALQCLGGVSEAIQHPLWVLAADALASPLPGAIGISAEATSHGLLLLCSNAATFWIALQIGRNRYCAEGLLRGFVVLCAVYTFYGLMDAAFGWYHVLFQPKYLEVTSGPETYVSATFVNRTHYAAYAGMGLCAGVAWCLDVFGAHRYIGAAIMLRAEIVPVLSSCIILLGLALSGSRGGVAVSFAALAVVFAAQIRNRRQILRFSLVFAGIVALAGLVIVTMGGFFIDRLHLLPGAVTEKMALNRLVLRAIQDRPLLGHGLGAFVEGFPLYRDETLAVGKIWNAAHASWLELVMGVGIPAALGLGLALALLVKTCIGGVLTRKRDTFAPIAALAASLLLGLHSLIDFSIQTPAVAMAYSMILGLGVAQSRSSRDDSALGQGSGASARLAMHVGGLVIPVGCGLLAAGLGGLLLRASLATPVQYMPGATPKGILDGGFGPFVSERLAAQAQANLVEYNVQQAAGDRDAQRDAMRAARDSLVALARREPADGGNWALLADIQSYVEGYDERAAKYLRLSFHTHPFEHGAAQRRVLLGLRAWEQLDSVAQSLVRLDVRSLLRNDYRTAAITFVAQAARAGKASNIGFVRDTVLSLYPDWVDFYDRQLAASP